MRSPPPAPAAPAPLVHQQVLLLPERPATYGAVKRWRWHAGVRGAEVVFQIGASGVGLAALAAHEAARWRLLCLCGRKV